MQMVVLSQPNNHAERVGLRPPGSIDKLPGGTTSARTRVKEDITRPLDGINDGLDRFGPSKVDLLGDVEDLHRSREPPRQRAQRLAAAVYEVPQTGIRGVRATVAKMHTASGTKAPVGKSINLESIHPRRNRVLSQEETNHRRLFLSNGENGAAGFINPTVDDPRGTERIDVVIGRRGNRTAPNNL